MAKKTQSYWDASGWKKGPVTFFQALGLSSANIEWPKLEPQFSQEVAKQAKAAPSGSGGKTGNPPAQGGGLQKYAQSLLSHFGWGSQFTSFNAIVMAESGWSPTVKNGSSGALGVAQALGHGNANTGGSLGNEYGGYGLTDTEARAANSGNGYWQLVWMMNYIKSVYGSPNAAWAFHKAHGYY